MHVLLKHACYDDFGMPRPRTPPGVVREARCFWRISLRLSLKGVTVTFLRSPVGPVHLSLLLIPFLFFATLVDKHFDTRY